MPAHREPYSRRSKPRSSRVARGSRLRYTDRRVQSHAPIRDRAPEEIAHVSLAPAPAVSAMTLSRNARLIILLVAFFGWFCAGMHMSIVRLTGNAAATDLLGRTGRLDLEQLYSLKQRARAT